MKKWLIVSVIWCWIFDIATSADARDAIRIVGSAAVLPFAQTVSENFATHFDNPSPSIDVTGAGKGFRSFCSGIGYQYPDITVTARHISDNELAYCRENGVDAIVEIIVGLDVIALVNDIQSRPSNFTISQLYSALSAKIKRSGQIIKNPHRKWSDVDPNLPDNPIRVMGPATNSTYYDAFVELIMIKGCHTLPEVSDWNAENRFELCNFIRKDGAFISGMNSDVGLLHWIRKNPDAFALVPLYLLEQYPNYIQANLIQDSVPDADQVASGRYPLTRPIFLYVKQQHVSAIKSLQAFLYEFTSERAIGPEGYLSENGFKHLDDQGRNTARDLALSLSPIKR
jgi:phosphate transport system substrate-binding protein